MKISLSQSPILKALILMALPVLELVGLRLYLHQILELRFGFPGFTDYELFLPAPLGFIAFILALDRGSKIFLGVEWKNIKVHFVILSAFIFLSQIQSIHHVFSESVFQIAWLGLLAATVISAFCVWINPREITKNPNFWSIGPSLLMVFSCVLYMKFGKYIWEEMVKVLGASTNAVLAMTGNEVVTTVVTPTTLIVKHPLTGIHVGHGCGGFDSLLFFFSAFSVFAPMNWEMMKARNWFLSLIVGCFFFLGLNAVRLIGMFAVGVVATSLYGKEFGNNVILGIFHVHAGYIIYTLGVIVYLQALTALSSRRPITNSLIAQSPAT